VGPVWGEGNEDAKMDSALQGSLARADALGLKSVAFPAISTGIFGFPKQRAAEIFFQSFKQYFNAHPESALELVRVTLWDMESLQIFLQAANQAMEET
jgi:O-acetyl-ADP-ribose deacetylase (regulator of RNase III)